MKKGVLIALLAICIAFAAIPIYSGPFPKYAVGQRTASPSWIGFHRSYAEVIREVPILVEVEITKHKGDIPNDVYGCGTLYEAKVLTCYKNETEKELDIIELVQDGNSEVTYDGYTLFQTGDRLLLPLLSCEKDSVLSDSHPEYYRIYGTAQTAMQIVESEDGEVCCTFLPVMEDLPTMAVTVGMWQSVREVWDRKYLPPDGGIKPQNPGSVLSSRRSLDDWIRKELAP